MSDTPETQFRYEADKYTGGFSAYENMRDHAMKLERERDEARRLAEKYRNLSCENQDEADHTILPWEKQP